MSPALPAESQPPALAKTPPRPRHREIDFWRGISLLAIFLIHVPLGPWGYFQWGAWGFSDPAALFFFLSGFVSFEAVERAIQAGGWKNCWSRALQRTVELYKAHLLLTLVVVAVAVLAAKGLGLPGVFGPSLREIESDSVAHPFRFLGEGTFFYSQHYCTDILPAFIAFSLVAPLANLLARKSPWPLAAAIVALWAIGRTWPTFNFPERYHAVGWSFNLLLWQVFYFGGALVARWRADGLRWPRLHPLVWLVVAGYLASLALVRQSWLLPQPYSYYFSLMQPTGRLKMTVEFAYIAHFFLLMLAVRALAGGERVVGWFPGAKSFEAIGRHSLWTFVGSTVAVYLVSLAFGFFGLGRGITAAAVVLLGAGSLPLVAWWCERRRKPASRGRAATP